MTVFFTGKDRGTNLLEIRTVLHQVHAASMMISIHMDTSVESLQHLLVSASPACSASLVGKSFTLSVMVKSFTFAVMIKSFTLAVLGLVRLTPDTCFGDVLHLVRQPGNPRTRALLDFLCFLSSI